MADNKDELGIDLDKMEDFDFDFDTDFGGDFFAEEPPPANKREAVTRSLKTAGKSFAEEFDVRDPEKIEKFIESAIPSSLSTEFSSMIDLKDSVIEELNKTGPEIKRNANKLLKTLNKYMPKGKISGGIEKLIGLTESEKAYNAFADQKSKEAMLEESINKMLETTLARDERNSAEERIRQEIAYRKDLNHLEISNHIVANLDRLINFENTVTTNYYKKSLDLQYRLLDTVSQTLELNKLTADANKNQLEAIIRNTSLPDVVKVRSAEVVKMLALQNTANSAMKSLFGEGTRLDRVKKRLLGVAKDKIGSFAYGLQSANMGVDMAQSMKEQSEMMGGGGMGSSMAGSMVGGAARDFLGELTGRFLEGNEKSANKIADMKEFFSDPRSWFKEKLDESYAKDKDPSFLERRKRDFLATMADATNSSLRDGYISIDRVNPDASAIYDNRTKNSITQTIPKLLSEILFNTAGTNLTLQQYTGITPNVDKLRIDATTGKLISEKASLKRIQERFEDEARSGGGAYGIRRATGTFLENSKVKLSEKDRAELDRAVSEYIMEGGKVTAAMFDDKKLLSKLKDKKIIKKVYKANEDFKTRGSKLDRSKARTDFNNYIDSALTSIKNPEQLFATMIKEGNLDQLEELGLIKLTEDGTPIVDNKRYKELISGAFYQESLKYAENDKYKSAWDKKAELDRLSKAKAKERVDNLKNKATEVKDATINKANAFKTSIQDGTIEKKIKEVLSEENLKNQSSILNSKAKDLKVKTLDVVNDKLDILKNEIDKILLTEENKEKIDEAKAKIKEAKDLIQNSEIAKKTEQIAKDYKINEKLDNAKAFSDTIVENIKKEANASNLGDAVKSIITVDSNGTAVLEKIESLASKKELTPEEKLDNTINKLNETMEKSNTLSEKELKSATVDFKDINKDGIRDGSFREKMGKAFRTGPKEVEKEDKDKEEKEDKQSGLLKTIFGALFGGLTSLLSGAFGGLVSAIGAIGSGIIGPLISGLASMLPGVIGGGISLLGKGVKGAFKGVGKFTKATKGTRGFERKMFGKLFGKLGGAALRKVPLLGLIAGGYMGYEMLKGGDMVGGLGTMVSSLLAQIPGIGTALSLGIDGLLGLRNDEVKQKLDIEVELENKKQELDERNAMMQKANENNWEKEAIMLQNKFDKYTAEQDQIRNKINELENGKFKTDSKEKLLEKEKEKLAKSERELLEAKKLQTNLDKGMESVKVLKDKRDKFLELSRDSKFPQTSRDKFKAEADKLDAEIVVQENKNNEMKKFIDSQNKADNVINKVADPKERLKHAEAAREKLVKAMEAAKEPNAVLAMSKAVAKHDEMISKIKAEIVDSSVTEEINNSLNVDNQAYKNEQELKKNPDANTKADGTIKTVDEVEADRQRKILEDRIAELEARKIRVNEEAKKKNAGRSGYGYTGFSSGLGGTSFGGDRYLYGGKGGSGENISVDIANEETIARNLNRGGDIKGIVAAAAKRAGMDPVLMQVMAAKESSFKTNAKNPNSSALGLYQFLNGTWQEVLNKYGSKYDLNTLNASRLDPEHSTLMAAEYLKANMKHISGVKPKPNITDAYLTHFLGPGGAKKLLSANPDESALDVVGKAVVNANPNIFIGNGRVRTVREVYDYLARQLAKTAGDFGIKITKDDVGGFGSIDMSGSGNKAKSNEMFTMGSNGAVSNIPSTPNSISPEQVKQGMLDNSSIKIAKDQEDRTNKINVAKQELEKRQTGYSDMQNTANSVQPMNNISDASFKAQIASTQELSKSVAAMDGHLNSISKNTADTVAVLQKIHDKLDNLNSGNNTKANNQSSNIVTKGAENAISLQRGTSVK